MGLTISAKLQFTLLIRYFSNKIDIYSKEAIIKIACTILICDIYDNRWRCRSEARNMLKSNKIPITTLLPVTKQRFKQTSMAQAEQATNISRGGQPANTGSDNHPTTVGSGVRGALKKILQCDDNTGVNCLAATHFTRLVYRVFTRNSYSLTSLFWYIRIQG